MKNQLGSNIKSLRLSACLTQKDFAQFLGVSVISVQSYESGNKIPRLDKLIKIADFFHINLDNLVRGKKIEIRKNTEGQLDFVFPTDYDSDWLDRMIPVTEKMLDAMKEKQKEFQ